eukprot:tig00000545_g2016.t1
MAFALPALPALPAIGRVQLINAQRALAVCGRRARGFPGAPVPRVQFHAVQRASGRLFREALFVAAQSSNSSAPARRDPSASHDGLSHLEPAEIFRLADAVSFDVDSTLCAEESIDVLAELAGVGEQVAALTARGMDGSLPFHEALRQRLELIVPTEDLIRRSLEERPPQLSPGVAELIERLRARGTAVYLVSGGFRQIIDPVAESLGLCTRTAVFANRILFDEEGGYVGFDREELTCRAGGKAEVVHVLKRERGHSVCVHIGDGATDLEASPPADLVVGYGGIVERANVVERARLFVRHFDELAALL